MNNSEVHSPEYFEQQLQFIDLALAEANEKQLKEESLRLVERKERILKERAKEFGEPTEESARLN